jgi:16S rRNA processing protein RimM
MSNDNYVIVGKVGSTYGVYGWLRIYSYTESAKDILNYSPWYLRSGDHPWETFTVEDSREYGKGIIAKLAGFDTPEDARQLTGKSIAIERSKLPKLNTNEFYWSDLEGLTVVNKNGETLGTVSYLIETGANDVLVIKGDKEYAIPYLPGSVVLEVNLNKKIIIVDWEII